MNSSVRQPAVPEHSLSSMLAIERIFRDSMVRLGCPRPSDGGHDQGYAAQILDHPNNGFLSDDDRAYDPGPR